MDIQTLKRTVAGEVVVAADHGFSDFAVDLVWNGRKPSRRPSVIVRARGAADVQAAVRYAAANGQKVSARGSGHHFAFLAIQDGVLVDLSAMNAVAVDVANRTAELGPTVRNGDLAAALARHGLAFPVGHCATVSLSGYLLGGGLGWNSGAWGLGCHNVVEVDVVLADGSLVTASETRNPDVFWAVRGGGPQFFGIVTAYRVRLHALPRAIRSSTWTYPVARAAEVERWMAAAVARAPAFLEFTALYTAAPPPLAGRAAHTVTAVATVFADADAEAAAVRAGIEADAPSDPLDVQVDLPTPFETLYQIMGRFFPEGARYAVDSNWSADGPASARHLAEAIVRAPSPRSMALAVALPPPAGPMPDAAFSMAAPVFTSAYAVWGDAAEDARNVEWLRGWSAAAAPVSLGHYVGEADLERAERMPRCYAPAAWDRLQALARRYDPTGVFHRPGAPEQVASVAA